MLLCIFAPCIKTLGQLKTDQSTEVRLGLCVLQTSKRIFYNEDLIVLAISPCRLHVINIIGGGTLPKNIGSSLSEKEVSLLCIIFSQRRSILRKFEIVIVCAQRLLWRMQRERIAEIKTYR